MHEAETCEGFVSKVTDQSRVSEVKMFNVTALTQPLSNGPTSFRSGLRSSVVEEVLLSISLILHM